MACEVIEVTRLQSEQKRDKLKEQVLALTDKQAEYVLHIAKEVCFPK